MLDALKSIEIITCWINRNVQKLSHAGYIEKYRNVTCWINRKVQKLAHARYIEK